MCALLTFKLLVMHIVGEAAVCVDRLSVDGSFEA